MIIKLQLRNRLKINCNLLRFLVTSSLFLFGLTLNAADLNTESLESDDSKEPSQTNPENKNSTSPKLSTDLLSNKNIELNNSEIIQATDFSKAEYLNRDSTEESPGFTNTISITAGLDYDSNPALVEGRKDSVWVHTLAPQASVNYVNEFNRLYLQASLLIQRPSNEKVLTDRNDPSLTIGWDRTYESGDYGISAGFSQVISRGQQIRTTGVFTPSVDDDSAQRTRTIAAKWRHDLTQRWGISTNGAYTKQAFSGGVNLLGSSSFDLSTRLSYENSEKLNTYVQLAYIDLRPQGPETDTDVRRLSVGANYEFTDGLKAAFVATQYRVAGGESDKGWLAGAILTYDTERMGYTAELNRELNVAGGVGGFQKNDTFRLGWAFNLSESDKFITGYSLTKSLGSPVGFPEQKFQEFNAAYNRRLATNWNARANLTYRELIARDNNPNGFVVGLLLVYGGLSF